MPGRSVDELKGQVSTGAFAVDSDQLAGVILDKFALIRRVSRQMAEGDEESARDRTPARRRGTPSAAARAPQQRRQRQA